MTRHYNSLSAAFVFAAFATSLPVSAAVLSPPLTLSSGWRLQDVSHVREAGRALSMRGYRDQAWYKAIVPGTVLSSLVNDGVYPEPLYGEANRPDKIPESLCRTSYWYRTQFVVPRSYTGKRIWLNVEGINYAADVWVNGHALGTIKGAFARGKFDITLDVTPGTASAVALRVDPQPHPGTPHEHTLERGMGPNGGETAVDGPTFLCAIGWDWIPAIRDRDTGIWQKVTLSATGPVVLENPQLTTDLPLPSVATSDVTVRTTVRNVTDRPEAGVLTGRIGGIVFRQPVALAPRESRLLTFDPSTTPTLRVRNPKLWWPNGYGPQNLYRLHLGFEAGGAASDTRDVTFGVRKFTYSVPGSENLTVCVNGAPIFCKGGDWGMDEAMKRIPRARLEAQIRMHKQANYTIIRNWVGQSTSEDFYELCDKYGLLVWDEFFQPNPGDGPNPTDLDTYLANVREKILRFRNHPSIVLWCARNEGYPPKQIDDGLRSLVAELDKSRLYQPSSTAGRGVNSGGPYCWRAPREYYHFGEAFKTEIGSVSIPTLESIHGMMPQKDWETIDDDWAEHDLAAGASGGDWYPNTLAARYGKVANLADFARKGQMMNYEAFRAMYEGRNAKLFAPCTGVITWMSNPAQPSFVWQLYHHDLEPNASLFAVRKACEPVHIQLDEDDGHVEVIDNLPAALTDYTARVAVYDLGGRVMSPRHYVVKAAGSQSTDLGPVEWPTGLSGVHFVKLDLTDASGKLVSDNFYWRGLPEHPDDLTALATMPTVRLDATVTRRDSGGNCLITVTLHNPTPQIALMAHLQLHRRRSGDRVLPVYNSDNYVSLVPGETRTLTIEAALADLAGQPPQVLVDGWNVAVAPMAASGVSLALNEEDQVEHWPITGLPIAPPRPQNHIAVDCGGGEVDRFDADIDFSGGQTDVTNAPVDTHTAGAGPQALYQSERWGESTYTFHMKSLPVGRTYTVRLHFAETTFSDSGKRRFDVAINGTTVLTDLDVFQQAGGKHRALVREFRGIRPRADGTIQIHLVKGAADEPELNGIEIDASA